MIAAVYVNRHIGHGLRYNDIDAVDCAAHIKNLSYQLMIDL